MFIAIKRSTLYNYTMTHENHCKHVAKPADSGNPTQKDKILQLILSGKSDNVAEISSALKISKMSVYRYVRALVEEKKISKTFNKLFPYRENGNKQVNDSELIEKCVICHKLVTDDKLAVIIKKKGGKAGKFCCAHCAIVGVSHAVEDIDTVSSIIGRDFLYGNPLDLRDAYLLLRTEVIPCCSPPILVFARREDAAKFKEGFGGEIWRFEDVVSRIKF